MKYQELLRRVRRLMAGVLVAVALTSGMGGKVFAESTPAPVASVLTEGLSGSTWDSCTTLQWKIYRAHLSRRTVLQVKRAVAELNRTTGLNFVYSGHATRAELSQPANGMIVIGFSSHLQSKRYAGTTRVSTVSATTGGEQTIVAAQVLISRILLTPSRSALLMPVLLHELGHAVGLTHVDDRSDVMYPIAVAGAKYEGAALTKLSAVGTGRACQAA